MDQHNLEEIYRLNQRGGRQLSLPDLLAANTVDVELAAYLAGAVRSGASLLTAARPGNAGKTTVLAALLAFLPPHRRIVTATDAGVIRKAKKDNLCLLAHEIGDGPYYGYLWGDSARQYFEAAGPNVSTISCLHADTLEELRGVVCGSQIGLAPAAFARIDLLVFLRLDRVANGWRRRVAAVYESMQTPGPQSHRRIFQWDEKSDRFSAVAASERWSVSARETRALLRQLAASRTSDYAAVYAAARA